MKQNFQHILFGISVLPALLVMPSMADVVTGRSVITQNTTYSDLVAENIASTTSNNGGVFYMQDVPNVVLVFDGLASFQNNSLNNGGMGGVIGNGWLSSTTGTGYTQGGKIVFNGASAFVGNSTNNANGAGAVFNYGLGNATNPDIIFYDATNFTGNRATSASSSVYAGGGAINHRNGMLVFNSGALFDANESASQGGAILSAGDMIFNGEANFVGNTAAKNGGALAIMGGNTTFEGAVSFSDNSAAGASAVYLSGSATNLNFRDSVVFIGNTGVGTVLNNSSSAKISFANGAMFDKNTNNLNGALVNAGVATLSAGDFVFTNNTGSNGGGLKNSGTVNIDTSGVVLFDNNITSSSAGALDNGGTIILSASDASFINNKSNSGYGGAIFNAGDLTVAAPKNVFSGNIASDSGTVKSGGGAIHNRGNTNTSSLVVGVSNSTNVFESNKSNAYGGAIVSRAFDGADQNSEIIVNGTTSFSKNQSVLDGGAIWNAVASDNGTIGTSSIVFNGDTNFSNNSAGGTGGAIYNNDTITFNGRNKFTGNVANGNPNDIYNDGTVNFNGDTTLDGGITGGGTLNVASGTTLNIGSSDIVQGAIVLDGTMMATLRSADNAQITVNNPDGFSGSGTLKLAFDKAGTYHVFGNEIFNNIDISNPVYDLKWSGGDVTATAKSTEDIANQNNINTDTAGVISGVSGSSSAQLNDLSVLFQEKLSSGTIADIKAVEQAALAINPEQGALAQSSGLSVQNTIMSLVSQRSALAVLGRSGGDSDIALGGVWAQGIYNKAKQNNAFNGYTRGISAGFDGVIGDSWVFGAGYLFSKSDVSSLGRDTDIDSHTVFLYGQYRPSAWYMNATVSYNMSDYTEYGSALGVGVSSDYDVDAFGASMATGYDFIGGITPELSLRYLHLNSTDYTNSLGIKNHFGDADYLTASIGTKYAFDLVLNNGFVLRPQMHYAVKYDLISDDNVITVLMPGINSYSLNGERLSKIANEIGIGIGMNYYGLEMILAYDIESRSDYTSQTGRLKFRYEF